MTVYVAEFWNTVSNISMIIPPLYGIWNARKYQLETRFFISHFMLLLGKHISLFQVTRTFHLKNILTKIYPSKFLLGLVCFDF